VRNSIIYLHTGELKHLHVINSSLFHTEGISSSLSVGYGETNGDRSEIWEDGGREIILGVERNDMTDKKEWKSNRGQRRKRNTNLKGAAG
jgi:hypothetical protein